MTKHHRLKERCAAIVQQNLDLHAKRQRAVKPKPVPEKPVLMIRRYEFVVPLIFADKSNIMYIAQCKRWRHKAL